MPRKWLKYYFRVDSTKTKIQNHRQSIQLCKGIYTEKNTRKKPHFLKLRFYQDDWFSLSLYFLAFSVEKLFSQYLVSYNTRHYFLILAGGKSSLHFLIKVQKEKIPRKLNQDPVFLQSIISNIYSKNTVCLPITDQLSDISCALGAE